MSLRKKILFPLFLVFLSSVHIGYSLPLFETRSEDNDSLPQVLPLNRKADNLAEGEKMQTFNLSGFASIAEKVKGRVVSVVATQSHAEDSEDISKRFSGTPLEEFFKNFMDRDEKGNHKVHVAGSGFFIQKDRDTAYVVTNSHIVENTVKVKIFLNDKTEIPAVIHGSDARSDLAVLKINMKDIPENKRELIGVMEWGDSDTTKVGHWVLAIGNPFGLGNTVTHGIISAKSRDLHIGGNVNDDFIQHSAQINVGNSGGCLLDVYGKVIGINTLIITPSSGNVGIGFAIPSNTARRVIQQLIEKQKVQRGALGIKVQDFTPEMANGLGIKNEHGAIVAFVEPSGPSVKAGIKEGDIILQFDDVEITSSTKLSRAVGDAQNKTSHRLKIIRKGDGNDAEKMVEITINVTLGDYDEINKTKNGSSKKSEDKVLEVLGMSLMNANEVGSQSTASGGAFIIKVAPDSTAEEVGLARGDIIVEINQKKITSVEVFREEVNKAQKAQKKNVLIRVRKGENLHFLSLKIDNSDTDTPESKEPIENNLENALKGPESKSKKNPSSSKNIPDKEPSVQEKRGHRKAPITDQTATKKILKGFKEFRAIIDDFFKKPKDIIDDSSSQRRFYR